MSQTARNHQLPPNLILGYKAACANNGRKFLKISRKCCIPAFSRSGLHPCRHKCTRGGFCLPRPMLLWPAGSKARCSPPCVKQQPRCWDLTRLLLTCALPLQAIPPTAASLRLTCQPATTEITRPLRPALRSSPLLLPCPIMQKPPPDRPTRQSSSRTHLPY